MTRPVHLIIVRLISITFMAGVTLVYSAHAQTNNIQTPVVEVASRNGDITIDGQIDEDVWFHAIPVTEFVQSEPVEGDPAKERIEVRVLYDSEAIYVGAVMYDREPHLIGDQLVRRDERGQFDYFVVSFDSNNDRRTAYRFQVSAAGVQRDEYMFNDVDADDAWDAVWASAVSRGGYGWSAELRIPLSQIQYFPSDAEQSWGVNFSRRRLASNELSYFALQSRIRYGKVSVFGRLTGLVLPKSARRLEMRPYVIPFTHKTGPSTPGNPFFDGSDTNLLNQGGLDMRYGVGSSHTLDVTINPDFGQVEVDPAVVNLSAFETFFPEKRPFFVKDSQFLEFGGRTRLFHSRRIGREPRGSAPDGSDFQAIPGQTSIIGAAKLTGRSASGLSIGALAALTGQEKGAAYFSADQTLQDFTVEPRTQYGVIKAQQDFRNGASVISGIATLTNRDLPGDGSFDFLTSRAFSAGLDFEHNWGGARSRDWTLGGYFAESYVSGPNEALIRIQRASNHFFQRMDATRFAVDSTATSMTGRNWRLQFERQSAEHWTGAVWAAEISPGFEINDLGFSTERERLDGGARIQYQEIQPGDFLRNYRFSFFTFHNWRHEALDDTFSWDSWGRAHQSGNFFFNSDFEFLNFWEVGADLRYSPDTMSDTATRGGPLMKNPGSVSIGLNLDTDRRRRVTFGPSFDYQNGKFGEYEWRTSMDVNFRPSPSVEVELEPRYSREQTASQYVTATDDIGYAPTFGPRYIFSDLKRNSISFETRVNMAFTPKLSLQLFAQPLLSSGDYLTYKALERSESFDFDVFEEGARTYLGPDPENPDETARFIDFEGDETPDFSFDDRDFNFRSLRMSLVLRWEYRPGSAVFFVWQQSRSNRENDGSFSFRRDLDALFGAESDNFFIVKLNYWFGA